MGILNISVSGGDLTVTSKEISTECSSVFTYTIETSKSTPIDILLSGNHLDAYYTSNGSSVSFSNSVTGIVYNNSLTLTFVLENSGIAASYETTTVTITNKNTNKVYTNKASRYNDSEKCAGGSTMSLYGSLLLGPFIFNPDATGVTNNTDDFTLNTTDSVNIVAHNGQILDDSEWSQVGDTLTVTPDNGFYDTTDEVLVYQSKITFNTVGNVQAIKEISNTYTQEAGDVTIKCIGTATFTITLLTAVGRTGEILNIKNLSTGTVTIDPDGAETIDGYATKNLLTEESAQIQSDGTNWIIL